MNQIKKMGGISDILSMLPGAGAQLKDVDIDEGALDKTEAIIFSMTEEERARPDIINLSRKKRIAAGAGVELSAVNS